MMGKLEDADEVSTILDTAEQVIPETLNHYFGTGFNSIYDLQDEEQIEQLRKDIKIDPVLKNIDRRAEPRYTEVLKWYRLFVRSLSADSTPLPVPAEQNPPIGVNESEPKERNRVITTIYREGESAEQLPKEIRIRNQKLREACKEYFRGLHGGRLVCECCGFDFEKAYGSIGEDYIEVHHRIPFSQTEGEHPVDATTDLVPLCSNCHSMIHRVKGQGTCMSLDDLKNNYKGIVYKDQ